MTCDVRNTGNAAPVREDRAAPGRTVVLGLGNTLLGDDGVGVHAISRLQTDGIECPDVVLLDGGTLSFTLDLAIEGAGQLIVVDAAQLGREPGAVCVFEGAQMDEFVVTSRKSSVHEVSLADLLAIAMLGGHLPQRRALIGIQPKQIDWSGKLTAPVECAVALACDTARRLICEWRTEGRTEVGES